MLADRIEKKKAFAYFGGVPAEIFYDNMKQVVIKRGSGGHHRFNEMLLDFAGASGFIPRFCRPYRAKTKGKVERAIGYIKDRFFCGRIFTSIEDMNAKLIRWLKAANRRIHATPVKSRQIDSKVSVLCHIRLSQRAPSEPNGHCFSLDPKATPEVQTRPLAIYEELVVYESRP